MHMNLGSILAQAHIIKDMQLFHTAMRSDYNGEKRNYMSCWI